MSGAGTKRTLSDRLAGMSFMRRGAERELRNDIAKRQRSSSPPKPAPPVEDDNVGDDEKWVLPAPPVPAGGLTEPLVIRECGLVLDGVAAGTFGRQSYGSFNPELERRNAAIASGEDPDAPQIRAGCDVRDDDADMKSPPPMQPPPQPSSQATSKAIEVVELSDVDDEVKVVKVKRKSKSTPAPLIAKEKTGARTVDESGLRKKRRKSKSKRTNQT